jgi:hypothetical protein
MMIEPLESDDSVASDISLAAAATMPPYPQTTWQGRGKPVFRARSLLIEALGFDHET